MSGKDKVVDVFSATLGVPADTINDETSPKNTREWDSLQSMNLVLALLPKLDVAALHEKAAGELSTDHNDVYGNF
jgi:acyl carrier protein